MSVLKVPTSHRLRRRARVRAHISGSATRPRLSVFKSAKHIYAQLIDDQAAATLVHATDQEVKTPKKSKETVHRKVALAEAVGTLLADKAKAKKITTVVFDRGGYRYHGRVKALAEGARAGGLEF